MQTATRKSEDSSASLPRGASDESHRGAGRNVRPWMLFLALFLFPFFFHAGTELYMFARAAMQVYIGMPVVQHSKPVEKEAAGGTVSNDNKILMERLSQIINNQQKLIDEGIQKVVIIRPENPGFYSFDAEKTKILELSGVDIDTPLQQVSKISKIKSTEILYSLIESFDRITVNAAQYNTSEAYVKNAIEGKKQALKRLQELR